jgi:hypothetical protein
MSEREQFDAWITAYALSAGIQRKRVELCSDISADMVSVLDAARQECYFGDDWHRDETSAIIRAEKMRAAKLASLDKQRARIAALSFP